MAYADDYRSMSRGHMITDRGLRDAMRKIVAHANAPQGSPDRMTKDELMAQIDILDEAERDPNWTVYYP